MQSWPFMLAIIAMACAGPVRAQEASSQDWALVEAPERSAVIAITRFDNGITLAGRCVNGAFDVTVAGLPPAAGYSRIVRVSVGDEELRQETWTVGADQAVAFSRLPSPDAWRSVGSCRSPSLEPTASAEPDM